MLSRPCIYSWAKILQKRSIVIFMPSLVSLVTFTFQFIPSCCQSNSQLVSSHPWSIIPSKDTHHRHFPHIESLHYSIKDSSIYETEFIKASLFSSQRHRKVDFPSIFFFLPWSQMSFAAENRNLPTQKCWFIRLHTLVWLLCIRVITGDHLIVSMYISQVMKMLSHKDIRTVSH